MRREVCSAAPVLPGTPIAGAEAEARVRSDTEGGEGAVAMLWLPKGAGGSLHRCTGVCLTKEMT